MITAREVSLATGYVVHQVEKLHLIMTIQTFTVQVEAYVAIRPSKYLVLRIKVVVIEPKTVQQYATSSRE